MALAFSMDPANPRSTSNASSAFLAAFDFMLLRKSLATAGNQKFSDLPQPRASLLIGRNLANSVRRQFAGDFIGALQSVNCGISGLLLGDIFAGGFAEGHGGFLHVQNIVGHLKQPPNRFSEP